MKDSIISLDIMRGFTVFLMILFHTFMEWMNWTPRDYGFFRNIMVFFGFLAPPFFLIISGMAYYFFINRKINENLAKSIIFSDVIKRSLFIFAVPTLIQIGMEFVFSIELTSFIYWSIFQIIGFSMVLFFISQFLKQDLRRILYLDLIFLFFLLDFFSSYNEPNYLSILGDGVFPFIPWINFYIIGLLFGDLISSWPKKKVSKNLKISTIIGIGGIISFFIWVVFSSTPNFIPYFMLMIGIFILLFTVFFYWIDIKGRVFYFQFSIIHWGKLAFSMYYIHFGLIALGILVFPLLIGEIYYFGFSIFLFIILIIAFFLSLEIFLRIWQRYNYFLGLEWFMNKISKKTLFEKDFS